jgi:uncharacterized protein YkwD
MPWDASKPVVDTDGSHGMQVDGLDALLEPDELQAGGRRGKHRRRSPRTAASVAGAGVALLAVVIALLGWRGISQSGQAAGATRSPSALGPVSTHSTAPTTSTPATSAPAASPTEASTPPAAPRTATIPLGALSPQRRSAAPHPTKTARRTLPVRLPSGVPPVGTTGSASDITRAVFDALNAARADAGLPALAWNDGLQRSAAQHDQAMAAAGQLSHQLPDEPDLGNRESAQGVNWRWAGENIGVNYQLGVAGALSLHAMMLAERPPSDGHRRNILSPRANVVGVDVLVDPARHALWLTEDFAQV